MDTEILFLINGHYNAFWDTFMTLASHKFTWVAVYISVLFVVWKRYSWRGVLGVLLMIGVGMLFTDWANAHLLRPWIGRLRPSDIDNPIAPLLHLVDGRRGGGYGMPSAHSANVWLLTFVVTYWLRNRIVAAAMSVMALTVCYSRIYLAFHYPGDILGGFALAAVVAAFVIWVQQRLSPQLTEGDVTDSKHNRIIIIPAVVVAGTMAAFLLAAAAG